MKWYDVFANFYDPLLEKLYDSSRRRAAELLDLADGQVVLDVACGTGANFRHLQSGEKRMTLYGTDFSAGMLEKADQRVKKNQWSNVHLFRADARLLSNRTISQHTTDIVSLDRIICVLGLSVIHDWECVMDNLLGLLKEGGKIVIVDVYAETRDVNTWLVEKVARADLNRPIWQTLGSKTCSFHQEYLPIHEARVGGKLFVARGTKPGG